MGKRGGGLDEMRWVYDMHACTDACVAGCAGE